jgi:hypothetical protein
MALVSQEFLNGFGIFDIPRDSLSLARLSAAKGANSIGGQKKNPQILRPVDVRKKLASEQCSLGCGESIVQKRNCIEIRQC